MKDALKSIVNAFHKYNSEHMATQAFGLSEDIIYDALVIAPSFSPYKLHVEEKCKVSVLKEGAYIAGYLVEKDGLNIAWIKIGSSAGNLIDHLEVCVTRLCAKEYPQLIKPGYLTYPLRVTIL